MLTGGDFHGLPHSLRTLVYANRIRRYAHDAREAWQGIASPQIRGPDIGGTLR
jgi:hypothetical protein